MNTLFALPLRGWMQFDTQLDCLRAQIDGQVFGDPGLSARQFVEHLITRGVALDPADIAAVAEECGRWRGALAVQSSLAVGEPITPLAFVSRFTLDEEAAIRTAGKTDTTIEVFLRRLDLATEIHLDHPLIIQGLQYLVSVGLLTEQRAAQIGS